MLTALYDRATNVRRTATTFTAMLAVQREGYESLAATQRAVARQPGVLTPLAHDHPDALLAAAGRTDANGYRYETVTRHHDDGRVSVRYVAPLRIGGPAILHPDGSGPILRAEYRRRDRASLVAAAVRRDALRHRAIAEDTIGRVIERANVNGRVAYSLPALTRADDGTLTYHRPSVLVILNDLGGRILTADRMARFCALETRRQHRAARVMVAPILRERDAKRVAARRAAETPEQRDARLAADKARRAARLAAETPEQRDARLIRQRERAAKSRARRAQKGA